MGTAAAIINASAVNDLSASLPVILCSPLDRAAGTRTRNGRSIAYALCAPEEEAQAHEDPSAGGIYSFAVVVRRTGAKGHVFHPHPEPVRAQQHAQDTLVRESVGKAVDGAREIMHPRRSDPATQIRLQGFPRPEVILRLDEERVHIPRVLE